MKLVKGSSTDWKTHWITLRQSFVIAADLYACKHTPGSAYSRNCLGGDAAKQNKSTSPPGAALLPSLTALK